jgi:hypothetical protein
MREAGPNGGVVERAKHIAARVGLATLTIAVVVGLGYALWLGLPLLNLTGGHFGASDIPVINTDAKIVRPLPADAVSPRSGVIVPQPSDPRPVRVKRKPALTPAEKSARVAAASTTSHVESRRASVAVPPVREGHDSDDEQAVASAESD